MKLILGVFAACALAGGMYLVFLTEDKYTAYVVLDDAGGILKNYNVKVGQVPAGKVTDIALTKGDDVRLKLELDDDAAPIGRGASAKVRPVNLLGEKYVDLDPGDLRNPLPEGSTIPKARTGVPIELDDALNVLDPDTRAAMRLIINEFGIAVAGRGADFNGVLNDLPPAVDAAERVVREVADENVALRAAITNGDRVLQSVAKGRDDLGDLVESAADALDTAAAKRAELGATVRNAPAALGQLRTTLAGLQTTADNLRPAARDLQAASPSLADTLARLPQFAKDAERALAAATKVSPTLSKLGRRSTPTLRLLRPTADRLAQFGADSDELMQTLADKGGMKSLLRFIDGWTGVTGQRDSLGHVFRVHATIDSDVVASALDRLVPKAKRKQRERKRAPKVQTPATANPAPSNGGETPRKIEVPLLPKLVDDVGAAVDGVLDRVGGLLQPKGEAAPRDGKQSLLSYLLGG